MATASHPSNPDERVAGSQFLVTLGDDLDYLDDKAAIFGKVVEGFGVLEKINTAIIDEKGRPLVDIRIKHTVVLDDPYPDPIGIIEPPQSPVPSKAQLATVRIAEDEDLTEETDQAVVEKARREREARAQALTLEMVGDLPFAEVKPPENVLFVCKLNPVTGDEDLQLIFSQFGTIFSCEVIRDKRTGDSLQYAFIEFADKDSCAKAYFKMQEVLIDDHRIHVDFSQSVSKLSDSWRDATNNKRRQGRGGGWGGVEGLEKRRQYRGEAEREVRRDRYGYVVDEEELRRRSERNAASGRGGGGSTGEKSLERRDTRTKNRSRSPRMDRSPRRDKYGRDERQDDRRRDDSYRYRDRGDYPDRDHRR